MQLQQSVLQALATAAQQASLDTKAAPAVGDSAYGAVSASNSRYSFAGGFTGNTEGSGDDQTGLQPGGELALALGAQVCAATISSVARFLRLRTQAVCAQRPACSKLESTPGCDAGRRRCIKQRAGCVGAVCQTVCQTVLDDARQLRSGLPPSARRPSRAAPHPFTAGYRAGTAGSVCRGNAMSHNCT